MIKTDNEDFKAGWDDEPASATVDEFEARGEAEERSLADKLAAGRVRKSLSRVTA